MKKLLNPLFSSVTTLILLAFFAVSIGSATFVEEKYDTNTAHLLIYNAWWFELILLLLTINMTGHIIRFRLWRKEKLASLTFHTAFIILIIGAALTRYISFEGTMHIREGQAENIIYSSVPSLRISVTGQGTNYHVNKTMLLGSYTSPSYSEAFKINNADELRISAGQYLPNAVESLDTNAPGGKPYLVIMVADGGSRQKLLLQDKEMVRFKGTDITFNQAGRDSAVQITGSLNDLKIHSPAGIIRTYMHGAGETQDTAKETPSDSVFAFTKGNLYRAGEVLILLQNAYPKAAKKLVSGSDEEAGSPILMMDVEYKGKKSEIPVFVAEDFEEKTRETTLDGIQLKMDYGNEPITLPFSLVLNDFILDRYAGSMSPSSYASEVTLVDERAGLNEKHRIFMNNVLDYKGFRFFQSSYDRDEKGTILSVNHDFWGTTISYLGYFLLAAGFVLALMNRQSRFRTLGRSIRQLQADRKTGLMTILLIFTMITGSVTAQEPVRKAVSAEHAEKCGKLLVQTFDGRFEPLQSLACDVMHKISRKDVFEAEGKGKLSATQVLLDMILDPNYWKHQKIIYIKEKAVQKLVGADSKYACFFDFLDEKSGYKLSSYAETAFRKPASEQNTFDKEIIRLDERLNVFLSVLNGTLLKMFPDKNSPNHKWISFVDTIAKIPFTGKLKEMNQDLNLDPLTYNNLMLYYLQSLYEGASTGNFSLSDEVAQRIKDVQREGSEPGMLPSETKIDMEIAYNQSNIFISLRNWYGLLGLVLIIIAFTENLGTGRRKILGWVFTGLATILGLAFLYHTYGMGLRWYISGHAPWSNGYEALLLAAWGTILAGFCFVKYSRITLAATAVLACSMLMTAGHSSYDPQLTNLQPVLKSYWLIIHVAVITISYGFLALGFILGLINLLLMTLSSGKNQAKMSGIISELTMTNEMALSVGIVMATVGTFLGGVWANESWGRYWGWDAKETWALVIVITYAVILHLRFVPATKNKWLFNAASVIGFGSVLMTFIGVNYYLTKGLHSYASGDTPVFPVWAWIAIFLVLSLVVTARFRNRTE